MRLAVGSKESLRPLKIKISSSSLRKRKEKNKLLPFVASVQVGGAEIAVIDMSPAGDGGSAVRDVSVTVRGSRANRDERHGAVHHEVPLDVDLQQTSIV